MKTREQVLDDLISSISKNLSVELGVGLDGVELYQEYIRQLALKVAKSVTTPIMVTIIESFITERFGDTRRLMCFSGTDGSGADKFDLFVHDDFTETVLILTFSGGELLYRFIPGVVQSERLDLADPSLLEILETLVKSLESL